jgi:hypothetical protein
MKTARLKCLISPGIQSYSRGKKHEAENITFIYALGFNLEQVQTAGYHLETTTFSFLKSESLRRKNKVYSH